MIVSIHQPSYFPWLGWLHKVIHSDVFILMDEVQLTDNAYQHRNLFLTSDGKEKYLNIAIKKKGYMNLPLKDIELLPDINWQQDHRRFLQANYAKHPYFNEVMPGIEFLFTKSYSTLGEVLGDVTNVIFRLFDIKTRLLMQSNMDYDRTAKKGDVVIALVESAGGDIYLSGQGAKAYQDEQDFLNRNIQLIYQDFKHPVYNQRNTGCAAENFIAGMATLDLLFNEGIEQSKKILYGL